MVAMSKKVKIHYRGLLDDGREFDNSQRYGAPLEISPSEDEMLPGFAEALAEMEIGDIWSVRIPPEEAYGAYDESLVEAVPFSDFPNADQLPVGEYISIPTSAEPIKVKVAKIEDGLIYFDHNHELAGEALNFEIQLIAVSRR